MSDVCFQARSDVAFRKLGDECVLVPIRSNPSQKLAVYTLNPVGVCVWMSLQRPCSRAEIIAAVVEEFDVNQEIAAGDVETFILELRRRELLQEVGSADIR